MNDSQFCTITITLEAYVSSLTYKTLHARIPHCQRCQENSSQVVRSRLLNTTRLL